MTFIFLACIILAAIGFYLSQKRQISLIKRNGVRVIGTVIKNKEFKSDDFYRLGGNLNDPTVRFITKDGGEIIGKPILGFTSQKEILTPFSVYIIYDSRNPQRFYIDAGS